MCMPEGDFASALTQPSHFFFGGFHQLFPFFSPSVCVFSPGHVQKEERERRLIYPGCSLSHNKQWPVAAAAHRAGQSNLFQNYSLKHVVPASVSCAIRVGRG